MKNYKLLIRKYQKICKKHFKSENFQSFLQRRRKKINKIERKILEIQIINFVYKNKYESEKMHEKQLRKKKTF